MDDFIELAAFLLLSFVVIGLIAVALMFGIVNPINANSCTSTAEVMQVESQYHWNTGCMVKTPQGRWMIIEQYNATVLE